MEIKTFEFNPLQENTYVLYDNTKECVIIDPGCYEAAEKKQLQEFVDSHKLKVTRLLNTHGHVDHVLGNAFVKRMYNVPLAIHRIDLPVLEAVKVYASHYGFFQYEEATADEFLEEDSFITFGEQTLKVLFVPGHSPGHVAFYHDNTQSLIGGDVLFYNSIGRTDLPGGDFGTLMRSIHQKLFALPDEVTVYPGHGPTTTIGYEKKTNPFCALR